MLRLSFRISLAIALFAVLVTGSLRAQSVHIQLSAYESGKFLTAGSDAGGSADIMLLTSKQVDQIRSSAIALNHNQAGVQVNVTANHDQELKSILSVITSDIPHVLAGNAGVFSTPVAAVRTKSILDQQTLHIAVQFDPTLAGGIVHVTAEIRPVFSGIGVTNHATACKSETESIEALTPEKLSDIVTRLTNELSWNRSTINTASN